MSESYKLLAHFSGGGTAETVWKHLDSLRVMMIQGIGESASCPHPPSPSIPSLSTAPERASHVPLPKHPPNGNAVGWKCKPWAIFYAHEKNKLSNLPRSSPLFILISLGQW